MARKNGTATSALEHHFLEAELIGDAGWDVGFWLSEIEHRPSICSRCGFRDYPRLPKFFRHRIAVALISPDTGQ